MSERNKNILIFILVMLFSISLELAFDYLNVNKENIYLIFVLSILIIIIESKKIIYGILASIVTVLSFNFFITEPKYTFVVNETNNYVSFIMFIVVTFMVNSLVIKLQKQTKISKDNEDKINVLYNVSSDLLHTENDEDIYGVTIKRLKDSLNGDISILTTDNKIYGKDIDIEKYNKEMNYALKHNIKVNNKIPTFSYLNKTIYPIKSETKDHAILLLDNNNNDLFVENIIEELVVALDKSYISSKQAETKLEVEKEKFKTSLLRGLSHDLKTPLTMIQSGSDFLYESYDDINDDKKKELINDIYNESCDLSNFVNNLLDLTRLENKNISLNKRKENVEDIIFNVIEKLKRRIGDKNIKVINHDENIEVEADIELLSQVFFNLIDNALSHTKEDVSIIVDYEKLDDYIEFKVIDDGGGIKEDILNNIFDDFYSITSKQDKKRSHGLGLSICKSIVEAHDGTIKAFNNELGGTTFSFTIRS